MKATPSSHARWHYLAALLPAGLFVLLATGLLGTAAGQVRHWEIDWVPTLGVTLALRLDGLSMLFGLVITAVGTIVTVYSGAYLGEHPHSGRYQVLLQAFMLAMLGLVLADNLILLFVFWEVTTFTSFLLIGFTHGAADARESARQALFVTGAGGLAMLAGFILIGQSAGTYSLTAMLTQGDDLTRSARYPVMLALVLAGAFTKSAQFPFHFWLPNAMTAPTPISAFLHSATMVKAGIYLLARLHPVLAGPPAWTITLTLFGALTALTGAVLAYGQTDLKRVLAYTTLMALGMLTLFLGGTHTAALVAAATFFLVHAIYKSALFLVVGILDHETGTRQLDAVRGLVRTMPWTAAATAAAALSMAGFPLFFGFVGKEIMYDGALSMDFMPGPVTAAAVAANTLMTAVAGILFVRPFLGPATNGQAAHEAPAVMFGGPLLLGGTGILFGIIPWWVARWLVQPAVRAISRDGSPVTLSLFHGLSVPLLLSIVTLSVGVVCYLGRGRIGKLVSWAARHWPLPLDAVYQACLGGVQSIGRFQTRWLQSGSLHRYLFVVMATFVGLITWALAVGGQRLTMGSFPSIGLRDGLLAGLIAAAVVAVVATRIRLVAIAALGVVGAGLALIFLIYGAPDVALTQLLVETLTVIIVAVVLLRLPDLRSRECGDRPVRIADGLLALAAGTAVAAVLINATAAPLDRTVTAFYEQQSLAAAYGRNIVNVILVDFRALDTLGEITVVALAGLAAYALIRRGRRRRGGTWEP
ncbi:MAG: proton-conducting transporter membrane subunit [Desulfobacterales bacterium]|nr:proton-conducting transporter membrane subunit [Desulfobacterales bacterium]